MKLFRKTNNPLFIEEEIYKWAEPNKSSKGQLLLLGGVFIIAGLLFGALN